MMTTKEHHPIFDECKHTEDDTRFSMNQLWVSGGYLYATDGRICVRSKTDEPDTPDTQGRFPKAAGVFAGVHSAKPLVLPRKDINRSFRNPCEVCDGRGEHRCNCPDCMTVHHDCEECDGKGYYTYYQSFILGDLVCLNGRYLEILTKHGCTAYPSKKDSKNGSVRFVFDCGEGVLMPMRYPERPSDWTNHVEVPQ